METKYLPEYGWAIAYPNGIFGFSFHRSRSLCIQTFMEDYFGIGKDETWRNEWRKLRRRNKGGLRCIKVAIVEVN